MIAWQAMSSFFMHSFDLHPVQLLMNIESVFFELMSLLLFINSVLEARYL